MAIEVRRVSVGSSGVTETSVYPAISEEEVSGLSVEQLQTASEELRSVCSLLQIEQDLFSRYLSSQQVQDDPTTAITGLSGSGTATPTVSSLDVRALWQGQVITKGRRTPATSLQGIEMWTGLKFRET
ncbi:hypothetical protein Pmani_004511 [Petrolisthes manimaculis]|uniref:Uncharacterized protein n=1 Tax=Petrolisthes manimaculis TaxID=1843537 RepID=A0AAE1ULH1_9EUCA|nr:hypothetical protein Pmani_004511 [Petrolisthes manimaculis]